MATVGIKGLGYSPTDNNTKV